MLAKYWQKIGLSRLSSGIYECSLLYIAHIYQIYNLFKERNQDNDINSPALPKEAYNVPEALRSLLPKKREEIEMKN